MNWLQERLNKLGYTHHDLQQELEKRGIRRVRATITGWTNDNPVSLLNNPVEAKILADVLRWSVLEMLIAAGYDIGIPQKLIPFIEAYQSAGKRRRSMFLQNLAFVTEFLKDYRDEDLDDPEPGDIEVEEGRV